MSTDPSRRTLLTRAAEVAMAAGVVVAYGGLGGIALRFLYPSKPAETAWLFVTDLASFALGDSMVYKAPDGARVTVARPNPGEDEAPSWR